MTGYVSSSSIRQVIHQLIHHLQVIYQLIHPLQMVLATFVTLTDLYYYRSILHLLRVSITIEFEDLSKSLLLSLRIS